MEKYLRKATRQRPTLPFPEARAWGLSPSQLSAGGAYHALDKGGTIADPAGGEAVRPSVLSALSRRHVSDTPLVKGLPAESGTTGSELSGRQPQLL